MGRLRKLSESLQKATFQSHSRTPSHSSPAFTHDDSSGTVNEPPDKNTSAVHREASSGSIPQATPLRNSPSGSRPTSMLLTPQSMDLGRELNIEELAPVFSYLSSHSNKLYQEGYFLKLNDLDSNGKPNADRNWTECFAQLVGTILSLWDAAALDAAGQDGEVAPTFVNLADASIKMIETLPTRNQDVQPLQNVLSISTAGKNRYLLHFNSVHSLTQWTAGIRLAMFENSSLQELYTGSLIAGKGKHLNNIKSIMDRSKFRHEDWARVRFGAGTPWRRCWCVIEPPDEKEWQKATKSMKKRSAYEKPPYPKGDIKFYDTKKTKKVTPIATITDAYAAYAIYPQAKPLIDQSTLVKVEGRITIHSTPESTTEGFVFVMPELHPAVSGFEMMLRWLFPVYDTFHLYGRPNRLIADTLDSRGLMFAMPKHKRYGYLDIMDMASLIHTDGSQKWSEREWRKQMKDLTAKRMATARENRPSGNLGTRAGFASSMGSRVGVHYTDDSATTLASTPSSRGHGHSISTTDVGGISPPKRAPTAPNNLPAHNYHMRAASESIGLSPQKGMRENGYGPPRRSMDRNPQESPELYPTPVPPTHRQVYRTGRSGTGENEIVDSRESSDSSLNLQRAQSHAAEEVHQAMHQPMPLGPVATPPMFQHQATEQPRRRPDTRPEMRREKSRMSTATLEQMAEVNKLRETNTAGAAAAAAWRGGRNENAPRGQW